MTSLPASADAAGLPAAWLRGLRQQQDPACADRVRQQRQPSSSGCYADLDGIESAVAVARRGDRPERTREDRT